MNARAKTVLVSVLIAVGLFSPAHAAHRRRRPKHTATPIATPVEMKPLVLLTGGTGIVSAPTGQSPAVLDAAEVYDPAAGAFIPIAPMTAHRDRDASAVLPGSKVLIVGGVETSLVPLVSFSGPVMPWILASTDIFDPANGRFLAGATMVSPRDEPSATLLRNGKLLVAGGGTDSAELYDPTTNQFISRGQMAASRYGQTATLLGNGRVLIAGGGSPQAELFDPYADKFILTGKMSDNRIFHTATMLLDGRVLMAGGSPYARSAAIATTEFYDPKSGTFKAGPKMKESRAGHTATRLDDGRVLIAGGQSDNSAELYDPVRHSFASTSQMHAGRYSHSAVLLPDGRVLIAGGLDQKYQPLASAEIYDPATGKFSATGDMAQARSGHTAILIWATSPVSWLKPTPTPTPPPTPTPAATPTPRFTPTPAARPSSSPGSVDQRTPAAPSAGQTPAQLIKASPQKT